MESVEAPSMGNKVLALFLEDLPDGFVCQLWMLAGSGRGDALVQQLGIQFLVAFDPDAGAEETLADSANLAFYLALLPARGRGAGPLIEAPLVQAQWTAVRPDNGWPSAGTGDCRDVPYR